MAEQNLRTLMHGWTCHLVRSEIGHEDLMVWKLNSLLGRHDKTSQQIGMLRKLYEERAELKVQGACEGDEKC